MPIVFWDSQEVLLAHFQKHGENMNSASHCEVLFAENIQANWQEGYCFIMTIPDLHRAQATQERIQVLQWEHLEHPPYSPDLAPTDFHLYDLLKKHFVGKHFFDDKEVETEVWKWLRQQSIICCGFQHIGKTMGQVYKCWWRICREFFFFFQVQKKHVLHFISIYDLFTDPPLYLSSAILYV
jgi:hypothetical protein